MNKYLSVLAVLAVAITARYALAVPPACFAGCAGMTLTKCYACCNTSCGSSEQQRCQDCCDCLTCGAC